MNENLAKWQGLARQGNPFLIQLNKMFEAPLSEQEKTAYLQIREDLLKNSGIERMSGLLFVLSWAATDARSAHRGRKDLVETAVALADRFLDACKDGTWTGLGQGDSNANRFPLKDVLEAMRMLKQLPEGRSHWPRWREKLAQVMEVQRKLHFGKMENKFLQWDDEAYVYYGQHANIDAEYMVGLALSAELLDRPDDLAEAREVMKTLAANMYPDGGFPYRYNIEDSPEYHDIIVLLLGRYYALTRDLLARQTLERTANYYPLSLTAEGVHEYFSSPWLKALWYWQLSYAESAVATAAWFTKDPTTQWLLWQMLARRDPAMLATRERGVWWARRWIVAADFWPPADAPVKPLPETFARYDENIRGLRLRNGPWYCALMEGRGLRHTFVGALISRPGKPYPEKLLQRYPEPFYHHEAAMVTRYVGGTLQSVELRVERKGKDPKKWKRDLFVSGNDNVIGLACDTASATAALGVRHGLVRYRGDMSNYNRTFDAKRSRPGLHTHVWDKTLPASPWQVTQHWYAGPRGVLGLIRLRAIEDTDAERVSTRIITGPWEGVQLATDGSFIHWDLWGNILRNTFGTVEVQDHNTVVLGSPPLERVKPGRTFECAVWVGAVGMTPPAAFEPLADDAGWWARWQDGSVSVVMFNSTDRAVTLTLPPALASARLDFWNGKEGKRIEASQLVSNEKARLDPHTCLLGHN